VQAVTVTVTNTGKQMLWSTQKQFNFHTDYTIFVAVKRKSSEDVIISTTKTLETRNTILAVCHERGDDWADTVKARILNVHDLHA